MRHKLLLIVMAALLGAGAAWLYTGYSGDAAPGREATAPDELIGQRRPDFSLGSTTGEFIHAADLDGQVVLINFWATWCGPCREEMPMLSRLHERLAPRGFQVLGIALDDVQQVRAFLEELDIQYPNAVGTVDVMAMGTRYGNRAGVLPYSVLLDREGIVRWSHLGEVKEDEISALADDLL